MIFNCGLTWEEKKRRREQWHPFFAIWPRVVHVTENGEQRCAWLQWIERKSEFWVVPYIGAGWNNEYRLPPSH